MIRRIRTAERAVANNSQTFRNLTIEHGELPVVSATDEATVPTNAMYILETVANNISTFALKGKVEGATFVISTTPV